MGGRLRRQRQLLSHEVVVPLAREMTANHFTLDRSPLVRRARQFVTCAWIRLVLTALASSVWICAAPTISWAQSQSAVEASQDAGAPAPPPETGYLPGERRALG